VLRALEEMKVPIDCIAGTSMGSIVGALYAIGYTPDEIETLVATTDWEEAFTDRPARKHQTMRQKELDTTFLIPHRVGLNRGEIQLPLGAIEGQHLDQILHRIMMAAKDISNFDDLPIPMRTVATDLVTGQEVVLSSGSLSEAVRASMSVPGVFAPVELDGRLLADGGMSNNLPISVARDLCADVVIAVDISSPLLGKAELTSVLTVTEQMTNFLTRRNVEEQLATLGPRDIFMVPDMTGISSSDFDRGVLGIAKGYEAAKLHEASLIAMAQPAYDRYAGIQNIAEKEAKPFIVDFVEIRNETVLNDNVIRSRLDLEVGQPLDLSQLERDLDDIYGIDIFQSVTYDLAQRDDGQTGVVVKAKARRWGPNYLQFGLRISDDFSGDSNYTIGAAYTRNALNPLGGELRVDFTIGEEDLFEVDFYQPIDATGRWFIEPGVSYSRNIVNVFLDDQFRNQLELRSGVAALAFGHNISSTDLIAAEYRFGRGKIKSLLGSEPLPQADLEVGELVIEHRHDSLDNPWFPQSGFRSKLGYRASREILGSSADFNQAFAEFAIARSSGKNSMLFNVEAGYSLDDVIPVERWWELGGLTRLSGLQPQQLAGPQYGLAVLTLYRRLNEVKLAPFYAGITLETGNTWRSKSDISVDNLLYSGSIFLGVDTPIGPIYFAWGRSSTNQNAVYFYLGNPYANRKN
jgi:NTE family protein